MASNASWLNRYIEKSFDRNGQRYFNDDYEWSQRERCDRPCCEKCSPRGDSHEFASQLADGVIRYFDNAESVIDSTNLSDESIKLHRKKWNAWDAFHPIPTWRFLLGWF